LREDNAPARLCARGRAVGLLPDAAWEEFQQGQQRLEAELARLAAAVVRPDAQTRERLAALGTAAPGKASTVEELLRRPEVTYADLTAAGWGDPDLAPALAEQVEIRVKYAGYVARQVRDAERFARNESLEIPRDFDYHRMAGLSNEVREKLAQMQPASLGQASRIPGVTPAAITVLLVHLKRHQGAQR
jgi:tRNA uridine 5-carboxymethylaminomethyl modification enzyme